MPIIEIDKSVLEEIENTIERKDEMYENQIAVTKKLTDSIEKVYEQEVKKLRNQLQQKENVIKEVREYIEHENFKRNILVGVSTKKYTRDILNKILEILDKEVN